MRVREMKGPFLALPLFLLGGCFKDPTATAYEKLVSIPENAQRCSYFSALPVTVTSPVKRTCQK